MKNILIIGSNRGIGLALTKEYAKDNKVTALCRKSSDELKQIDSVNIIEDAEVTDEKKIFSISEKLGDLKFDTVIHVSGIWTNDNLFSEKPDWSALTKAFEVNSIAPLKTISIFKKNMKEGTKVGLVSSRMGSIEDNDSGSKYAYRMSKAALNAAGKGFAVDFKDDGISVAILHPGFVKTDMTDGKGNMTPKESAQGIIKVMENLSMNNTGEFWHANGEKLPW